MGTPILESESNLKKAKLLLSKFFKSLTEKDDIHKRIRNHDFEKIKKIESYISKHNAITLKQFKALRHYSKVYNIKILQSMDFILS